MSVGPDAVVLCSCGAQNPAGEGRCWLCLRELAQTQMAPSPPANATPKPVAATTPQSIPGKGGTGRETPIVDAEWVHSNEPETSPFAFRPHAGASTSKSQFSIASLFLLMTLAAVALGVFVAAPGLGILMAILALPAFIRTTLVVQRRSQQGAPISTPRKVLLFCGSLGTIVVASVVVIVTSVGTFCAICLSSGKETTIPIAATIAGVVTLGACVLLWKWTRYRWRRDVSRG